MAETDDIWPHAGAPRGDLQLAWQLLRGAAAEARHAESALVLGELLLFDGEFVRQVERSQLLGLQADLAAARLARPARRSAAAAAASAGGGGGGPLALSCAQTQATRLAIELLEFAAARGSGEARALQGLLLKASPLRRVAASPRREPEVAPGLMPQLQHLLIFFGG